jgi:hypothetical protein
MPNTQKKSWQSSVSERILRGVLLVMIVSSILLGWVGIHNVDLAVNFMRLPNSERLEDCNAWMCQDLEALYVNGLTAIEASMALSLIVMVFLLIERRKQ